MKKKFFVAAIGLFLFSACKKDNTISPSPEMVRLLANKWKVSSIWDDSFVNGNPPYRDTYTGKPTDYMDFRNDNKMYSNLDGQYDTFNYQILNNNQVLIDNRYNIVSILNLTDSTVRLWTKTDLSFIGMYTEHTTNLIR